MARERSNYCNADCRYRPRKCYHCPSILLRQSDPNQSFRLVIFRVSESTGKSLDSPLASGATRTPSKGREGEEIGTRNGGDSVERLGRLRFWAFFSLLQGPVVMAPCPMIRELGKPPFVGTVAICGTRGCKKGKSWDRGEGCRFPGVWMDGWTVIGGGG